MSSIKSVMNSFIKDFVRGKMVRQQNELLKKFLNKGNTPYFYKEASDEIN